MNQVEFAFMRNRVQMTGGKGYCGMNLNGYWWSEYKADSMGYVCIKGVWCKCCLRCAQVMGLLKPEKRLGPQVGVSVLTETLRKLGPKAPYRDICRARNHLLIVDVARTDKYQIGSYQGSPHEYKVFSIVSLQEQYNTLDEARQALSALRMSMMYEVTLEKGECLQHKIMYT
jgi:hypothetical protein